MGSGSLAVRDRSRTLLRLEAAGLVVIETNGKSRALLEVVTKLPSTPPSQKSPTPDRSAFGSASVNALR